MTESVHAEAMEIAAQRLGRLVAGKWRLERVLGVGGMATVYAARHATNGRAVALKLLHPELTANADVRKRFAREGYIANRVSHPSAVAVHDDGIDDDGNAFLLMDLLAGQSLHERVKSAPGGVLGESEVLFIADSVLDVLAAAHTQGVVHRDLKPDNIFITDDGVVRVLDFGIARLLERPKGEESTQTGLLIGTPAYMPPEQARGRSKAVDARSDLWSLGAILFTLLTGQHVHGMGTPTEAVLRAMTAHAPPLTSVLPTARPAVAALIDRALAFEPADRWQDARAMQEAVRDARKQLGKGARDQLRRRRLRGGVLIVALAVGGFALVTSLVAPARLRRVGDAMEAIRPALVGPNTGALSASDAGAARAESAPPSARQASPPRPKAMPRARPH